MFNKTFKNVKISTAMAEKRGCCLEALNRIGEKIYMDFCGMNPVLVPDGTNAYFFGNSLILVTRWSDMSDEEKRDVEKSEIKIVVFPYPFPQFGICIAGNWGDVFVNLYHCYRRFNNINAPIEEIILVFSDTHDAEYVTSRRVEVPESLKGVFKQMNEKTYEKLNLDGSMESIKQQADKDPSRDFCDYLYDINLDEAKKYRAEARKSNLGNVPNGVYITISSQNIITDIRHNAANNTANNTGTVGAMSAEAKMYLVLAEKGLADAQYNLGVCYETGDGVEKNWEKAVYWYNKAALQGYAKAQYNLGVCYYGGNGVEKNYDKAFELFSLSANQGDMYAQFNLAVCYYNGIGTKANASNAAKWLQKAAEQGHPDAKEALGIK